MARNDPTTNRWMSIAQVSEYLGVSEQTVRRWIAAGVLPGYRVTAPGKRNGRLIRLDRKDVDALLHRIPTTY